MSLCVGAHGWVVGIASHGSVLLSRDCRLTAVKAPGHPGIHLPLSLMQLLSAVIPRTGKEM